MRHNPNITKAQLVAILGISDTAVDNAIRFLRENGSLKELAKTRMDIWKLLLRLLTQ